MNRDLKRLHFAVFLYENSTLPISKHLNYFCLADVIEIYRRPVTTSQEVARWRKDEPIKEREPWTIVKRRVRVNSEMTK